MTLTHPEFLWVFLTLPPLVVFLILTQRRALTDLLEIAPVERRAAYRNVFIVKYFFSWFFFLAGLVAVGLALVGLSWDYEPQPGFQENLEIAFVVDVSPSMLAADVAPTRLDAVRGAIYSVLPSLAGNWFALAVFRGTGVVLQPLSQSENALRNLVRFLHPSMVQAGGSNLAEGILAGVRVLQVASNRRKIMVVFSDLEVGRENLPRALRQASEAGIKILLVGVGTREGAKVPAPNGTFVRNSAGQEVISRFDEGLFESLGGHSGVDTYLLAQGQLGLAQKLGLYKNPGYVLAVRPRATGSLFFGLAVLFVVLSWLIRVSTWKNSF